jgi:peptidoglycan/xylan/chitin deacetylase (PgdA/CDA1 family)
LWATANALGSHAHSDDEWVMTEFGISELIDDVFVDLTDVREVQLVFPNGPAAGTRVFVDNVRTVPYEPRRGAVLFTADDGRPSQLSVMRPVLREHDFPSVHFNMMGAGEHDHMSVAEQRTLAEEDGCYVCPHPQHPTPLPNMSDEESMVALQNEYEYVATESGLGLGHEHARFMSWPYGKSDAGTIRQAKEFYELGFDGVDRATTAWRSAAPMSVMRASFDSLEDLTDALDIAEHYGRVLIPQFHRLRETEPTGGTNITPDDFRAFVADVASRDVDVISVAEFAAVHQN